MKLNSILAASLPKHMESVWRSSQNDKTTSCIVESNIVRISLHAAYFTIKIVKATISPVETDLKSNFFMSAGHSDYVVIAK